MINNELDVCEFCGEEIFEREISSNKWERGECHCFLAKQQKEESDERSNERLRNYIGSMNNGKIKELLEMDKVEYDTLKSSERMEAMTKDTRISLLKHNISSVDIDMITDFYLDDSKIKIPKSYFWKIKSENPRLSLSDYIDHIWKLQSEGVDPANGDAKLVVYDGGKWIDGKYIMMKCSYTVFAYKYFIRKAEDTGKYGGHETTSGIGDYQDLSTGKITQETFVKTIVHRTDRKVPNSYTAWMPEFMKKDKMGYVTKKWREGSMTLLTKSSITNCLKQTFPKVLDMAVDFESMEI